MSDMNMIGIVLKPKTEIQKEAAQGLIREIAQEYLGRINGWNLDYDLGDISILAKPEPDRSLSVREQIALECLKVLIGTANYMFSPEQAVSAANSFSDAFLAERDRRDG